MSISHLADLFPTPPRRRFAGDFGEPPRPLPNPPMPPQGGTGTVCYLPPDRPSAWPPPPRPATVTCDYCGSVIEEGRCPSCGAPRRRAKRTDLAAEGRVLSLPVLPDPTYWGPHASGSETPWFLILAVASALLLVLAGSL